MKSLVSVRINEGLLQEMKLRAKILHVSQTEYIRRAIELMNNQAEKQEKSLRMKEAGLLVRKESMKVNAEFGEIDHDPEV